MKLPCEIICDLLPLYHDGVCSESSRNHVEEHLKECESCAAALRDMKEELNMPELEQDEAKPLKAIRAKWKRRAWISGAVIGLMLFFAWFWLTQSSSVKIMPEEYEITNVLQFSNGMYYLEYRLPYDYRGMGADLRRTEDGAVYLQEYRPLLVRKDCKNGIVRDYIIDPENHRTDLGTQIPMTAFYLGAPESEDSVLLWSAEEKYPLAVEELEEEYLYRHIFR